MKRKNYSKELKSKVALAAIKGNQTANEIASEFGIHASFVDRWKKEAIEALPLVFGNSQAKKKKQKSNETVFIKKSANSSRNILWRKSVEAGGMIETMYHKPAPAEPNPFRRAVFGVPILRAWLSLPLIA